MTQSLTNQTRKVLALANEAARSFNHAYVGTEHVLLGLIEDRSAGVADILATFGIDADKVCAEIERLVQRGAEPVTLRTLPLTPRAARAVDHARFETRLMGEACVRPEHIFLGLMNEPAGVACQVLVNLGISLPELTKEVFKVFVAQMKVVERIVRPVQASTPRKRKIREELLAHLSAIYDQELARSHNPTAALQAAAVRLGDAATLADELQRALPFHERISHFVESWFTWRAPETIARYALRQATVAFGILAVVLPLAFAGVILRYGWFDDVWTFIRVLSSILLITPPAQFIITLAWIKMRDSLWGVFGSRKSLVRAFLYDAAIGAVLMAAFIGFAWTIRWDFDQAIQSLEFSGIVGLIGAIASLTIVRLVGPATIRDTLWAQLDTESA